MTKEAIEYLITYLTTHRQQQTIMIGSGKIPAVTNHLTLDITDINALQYAASNASQFFADHVTSDPKALDEAFSLFGSYIYFYLKDRYD